MYHLIFQLFFDNQVGFSLVNVLEILITKLSYSHIYFIEIMKDFSAKRHLYVYDCAVFSKILIMLII